MQLTASLFAEAGLEAAVIGGVARNYWELPRLTYDLDLTVAAEKDAVEIVVRAFVEHGYEVMRNQGPEQRSGPDFVQLLNPRSHQVVELQAAKTDFQALVIERGTPIPGAEPLRVASREDVIVLKLIAFRRKDQDDLVNLANHPDIDWGYIEHWADVWQVSDRLPQLHEWIKAENAG